MRQLHERIRLLVLTNEESEDDHPGHRDAFAQLEAEGSIATFRWAAPKMIAQSKGVAGAHRELLDLIRGERPEVIVCIAIQGFPFPNEWFTEVVSGSPSPILLYVEHDAWGRWRKPVPSETRLWWRHSDVVFSVAVGKQRALIEHYGGRDVRHIPNTYDHIRYAVEEDTEPPTQGHYSEVALIGNAWGRRFLSRLPGASERIRLVRALQADPSIPLAIYGANWTGRGAKWPIHVDEQAAVVRRALMTANWDHFPGHAGSSSDRLWIQLLAGRAHVTTRHPASEWLPGPEKGLFLEPSPEAAVARIRELLARPREEVLEVGLEAHRWTRRRLSHREFARYVLGAVDPRLLEKLPEDPWMHLPH